jgi:hypothetical protein
MNRSVPAVPNWPSLERDKDPLEGLYTMKQFELWAVVFRALIEWHLSRLDAVHDFRFGLPRSLAAFADLDITTPPFPSVPLPVHTPTIIPISPIRQHPPTPSARQVDPSPYVTNVQHQLIPERIHSSMHASTAPHGARGKSNYGLRVLDFMKSNRPLPL